MTRPAWQPKINSYDIVSTYFFWSFLVSHDGCALSTLSHWLLVSCGVSLLDLNEKAAPLKFHTPNLFLDKPPVLAMFIPDPNALSARSRKPSRFGRNWFSTDFCTSPGTLMSTWARGLAVAQWGTVEKVAMGQNPVPPVN